MKKFIAAVLIAVFLLSLTACGQQKKETGQIRVFVLNGPTGIGAANLWSQSDAGKAKHDYRFSAVVSPDEIVAKISNGEADIAAISTNLAAKLYQKTGGKIQILAVNTLGVLSALQFDGTPVKSIADLKGRTVVTTGEGANPQYILEYLLRQNGLDPQNGVKIKYKADASELSAVWNTEKDAIIVAPSPASAAITVQYPQARKVLDFTEEWQKCSPDSRLMMGCVVARTEFCQKNPELINDFLAEYKASVSTAGENPEATGKICEQYGIVAKAALVVKGLDDCHLCFITGDEMENGLTGYLKVLYESDPATVGKLPDKEFWYKGF